MLLLLLLPSLLNRCEAYTVENLWNQVDLVSPSLQEDHLLGLVSRLLGERAGYFRLGVDPSLREEEGRDVAVIQGGSFTVSVVGSTGVAAAWGLHHYLQYYCGAQITWQHKQFNLPEELPPVNLTLKANDLYRYYSNVCTYGYSFVWWQWNDWERHIDWMALNGVNLPLAFTGQEEIWRRVWTKLGITQEELDSHFTGPAFLPWGRMGNLRGWGGPLTRNWHKYQVELQHKILDRMRGLGMMPVLPAFAGQVPDGFVRRNPNTTFTLERWKNFNSNYSGVYMLSPTDPMFAEIGNLFLEEQCEEFGTNHIYNVDTFNEMRPTNSSPEYLSMVGQSVFKGLSSDHYAVWVMQGWLFLDTEFWGKAQVSALVTSVPQGKMLVLDLDSTDREQYTRTQSYFGQPFIFNMIHTFGGQLAMFGRKDNVNERPTQARNMVNSTMVGTGFAMEGIYNSYVMYSLLSEMSWRQVPVDDLDAWFQDYARRRYGSSHPLAGAAWDILAHSVYSSTVRNPHGKVLVLRPPSLRIRDLTWYNVTDVLAAWELLLAASPSLENVDTFQYDLADITRQALVNLAPVWFHRAVQHYRRGNLQELHQDGETFIECLLDLDRILATRKEFLLGPWLKSAKILATTEEESRLYEFNARNQITLWGPEGQILDYGGKQWSGLMSDYYIPRWKMFFKTLEQCLITGTKFDSAKFKLDFLEILGKPFTESRKEYPEQAVGDTVQVSMDIHSKWRKFFHLVD